ncbi:MAG: DnaJ domain-containing protein [Clostridiales bacterium]|nr:DnaJ domain-containing protein [Clostridiales bacterium]
MKDPYKVLNVSPDASTEAIKQAYRELARKYHPDNYADNPLSDLAEEKMKEINEAYDQIMRERAGKSSGGYTSQDSGYSSYTQQGSYGGSGIYARIRQYIMNGNLLQAEQMLQSVPDRNAEWYFLMGALCQRKGWFDEALRYYRTAAEMDPSNMEYRQALNMMQSGGRVYRAPYGYGGSMTTSDCCMNLICADCLCECLGGNLIPCVGCR